MVVFVVVVVWVVAVAAAIGVASVDSPVLPLFNAGVVIVDVVAGSVAVVRNSASQFVATSGWTSYRYLSNPIENVDFLFLFYKKLLHLVLPSGAAILK